MTTENILVIKLGALGDFIQALGPMAAIRKAHPNAHITLLTTKPFEGFARDCGYFNNIWLDEKPKALDLISWNKLRKKLNSGEFSRVYDLQNNDRTSFYFNLLKPKPEWVGAAKGASHQNASPHRTAGHAFDGHVQTLGLAGITDVRIDPLNWMKADTTGFNLKKPFALLVPGCAPQHPQKRWPAHYYGELATYLNNNGIQPVILGTASEAEEAQAITNTCPKAANLTGQTTLPHIAALARDADLAIGNDTGPIHLIAATGCRTLALFSGYSNTVKHAPQGENAHILQNETLKNLPLGRVTDTLKELRWV